MAISLKSAVGLQVVVATPGTSVVANPQPYEKKAAAPRRPRPLSGYNLTLVKK